MSTPRTVLVTGGAGFIGSHLVDELQRAGHRTRVLDDLSNGSLGNLREALEGGCRFLEGDVLAPEDCRAAVDGVDVVYHLACLGVRHSLHSPIENFRTNGEGALRVLEAAREARVPRFVYVSSSEIYGANPIFPITEDCLPAPTTVYGAGKLAGEHLALAHGARWGIDVTVLRLFNAFGPRSHVEGDSGELIPRCIASVLAGRAPVVFGDGSATRDFLFVRDAARALAVAMDVPELGGATFNVGVGVERTVREVVLEILDLMGRPDLGIRHVESRPADLHRLWVRPDRFRRATGFEPSCGFRDGLLETIEHVRSLADHGWKDGGPADTNWTRR